MTILRISLILLKKRIFAHNKFNKYIQEIKSPQYNNHILEISNREDKWKIVKKWSDFFATIFDTCIDEKTIYYIDYNIDFLSSYLKSTDNQEVFVKGLFEFNAVKRVRKQMYFAFINLPEPVFYLTRNVVLSFYPEHKLNNHLQLFFHVKEEVKTATLFGTTVANAIKNDYLLSLEHGSGMFSQKHINSVVSKSFDNNTYKVAPFDTILKMSENEDTTLFDEKIRLIADNDIQETTSPGYKIKHTHMRLGNKVHITGFYEMSFLFYHTNIANRFAFEIIRDLKERALSLDIDIFKDNVLFYGYASYSKAILTSVVEIIKAYKDNKKNTVGDVLIAAYQHNIQINTSSDEIQMYYGFLPNKVIENDDNSKKTFVVLKENTKVIQVVPISSTLTTFKKMWLKFQSSIRYEMVKN